MSYFLFHLRLCLHTVILRPVKDQIGFITTCKALELKKVYFHFMTVAAGSHNKKVKQFSKHSRHGTLCLQCSMFDFDSSKCREVRLQFSHFYTLFVH